MCRNMYVFRDFFSLAIFISLLLLLFCFFFYSVYFFPVFGNTLAHDNDHFMYELWPAMAWAGKAATVYTINQEVLSATAISTSGSLIAWLKGCWVILLILFPMLTLHRSYLYVCRMHPCITIITSCS